MSHREMFDLEILSYLTEHLDQKLLKQGFARASETRQYHRFIEESQQVLNFHFEVEPRDDPTKELLIRPKIQILLPALSQMGRKLTGGSALILPAPDMPIALPLSPNLIKSVKIGWFANGVAERKKAIEAGGMAILEHGLPFVEKITTAEDLIALFESKGKEIRMDSRMIIFVLAAYKLSGQTEKAHTLAHKHFSKARMVKQYGIVLENIGKILE